MKLIILSITQYKEKDGIITSIGEDGVVTFNVRGLLDPKSKNHALNTPLIEADVTFSEGNLKHKTLKSSSVTFSPYSINDPLNKLSALSMIQEATVKMIQEDELSMVYQDLKKCIQDIKQGVKNPIILTIAYLLDLLKITGNELEFNQCVFCGSQKQIVNFSFSDGGFVCRDCAESNLIPTLNTTQMKLFRNIYLSKNSDAVLKDYKEEDVIVILKQLVIYIYDSLGVRLKSLSLVV